jgi:hypothetical protein
MYKEVLLDRGLEEVNPGVAPKAVAPCCCPRDRLGWVKASTLLTSNIIAVTAAERITAAELIIGILKNAMQFN